MNKNPQRVQALAAKLRTLAEQCAHLSPPEQQQAYYYAGKTESAFLQSIASGDAEAQSHATGIILSGQYLSIQDAEIYNAIIRPVIHQAYRDGALSPALRKTWLKIEEETLFQLLAKGYYSEPAPEQEAALNNIPHQHSVMQEVFGIDTTNYDLEFDEWPTVQAPKKLISKLCTQGAIPTALQEPLCNNTRSLLMDFYHAEATDFAGIPRLQHLPQAYTQKQCYFFGRENEHSVDWLIAPFSELEPLCGLCLAIDGSFFCIANEWQERYGKVLH